VQQQQQERQRHLQEACLALNDTWSVRWNFVVSHDLRFIFCMVGKAGCTSWVRSTNATSVDWQPCRLAIGFCRPI